MLLQAPRQQPAALVELHGRKRRRFSAQTGELLDAASNGQQQQRSRQGELDAVDAFKVWFRGESRRPLRAVCLPVTTRKHNTSALVHCVCLATVWWQLVACWKCCAWQLRSSA